MHQIHYSWWATLICYVWVGALRDRQPYSSRHTPSSVQSQLGLVCRLRYWFRIAACRTKNSCGWQVKGR